MQKDIKSCDHKSESWVSIHSERLMSSTKKSAELNELNEVSLLDSATQLGFDLTDLYGLFQEEESIAD